MKKLRIIIYVIFLLLIFNINVNASSLKCVYGHLVVTYNTDNYKFTATSDTNYVEYEHTLSSTNFKTSDNKLMCLDELYVVSYGYIGGKTTRFVLSVYKKDAQIVNGQPYSIPLDTNQSYVIQGSGSSSSSHGNTSRSTNSQGGGSQGGGSQGGGSQGGSSSVKSSSLSSKKSSSVSGMPISGSSGSKKSSSGSSVSGMPTGSFSSSSSSSADPEDDTIDCPYISGDYNAILHYKKNTQEILTESTKCTQITHNAKAEDFSSGNCPPAKLTATPGRYVNEVYCNIAVNYPGASAPSQIQYGDSIQSYNSMSSSNSFKIPDIGGDTGFGKSANCKKVFGDAGYKIINGLIRLLRILAPIVAILIAMITLIPAVTAKDESKVKAATSKCVTIGIVLLIIEVIPYLIRLVGVILDFDLSCIG